MPLPSSLTLSFLTLNLVIRSRSNSKRFKWMMRMGGRCCVKEGREGGSEEKKKGQSIGMPNK